MATDREVILLKIRNLIADKEQVTALANRELCMGGWLQDHQAMHDHLSNEIDELFQQLEADNGK